MKTLPSALDAEHSLLSACLLGAADQVADQLDFSQLYALRHQTIFKTITDLVQKKHPVDLTSVIEALRVHGRLEGVGGASYISKLVDFPAASSINHYCELVRQTAKRREIIELPYNLAKAAYDECEFDELLNQAQRSFLKIDYGGKTTKRLECYKDLAYRMPEQWEKLNGNRGLTGIPSGFRAIDNVTGGFQCTDLCSNCNRRVAILFGAGKSFYCRHCYRLTYTSQQETRYKRLLRKARKIRNRLNGDEIILNSFPPKPKSMHWKTYRRLYFEFKVAKVSALNLKLGQIGVIYPPGL